MHDGHSGQTFHEEPLDELLAVELMSDQISSEGSIGIQADLSHSMETIQHVSLAATASSVAVISISSSMDRASLGILKCTGSSPS